MRIQWFVEPSENDPAEFTDSRYVGTEERGPGYFVHVYEDEAVKIEVTDGNLIVWFADGPPEGGHDVSEGTGFAFRVLA